MAKKVSFKFDMGDEIIYVKISKKDHKKLKAAAERIQERQQQQAQGFDLSHCATLEGEQER